jgi:beta-N-acetylhexosaminidase
LKRLLLLASVAAAATLLSAADLAGANRPSIREMVGQLMLVRMHGQSPSASFLARVRAGQIGGVVLFNDNFCSAGPAELVARLQAAAKAGHQPPLLIAIDQEGGIVKRLAGAPSLSPSEMRSATIAKAQGLATARSLKPLGINVDLAPVVDVGHGGYITSRSFGTTPVVVARRGVGFAAGLLRGGVLPTVKHFPGLGYATLSTDDTAAKVTATDRKLKADWLPYRAAIRLGVPLVMMSTATYPALGSSKPAALSPNIVRDLRRLGFKGVIITDALKTPAVNMTTANAAVAAIKAGDDLVLTAGVTGDLADTDRASVSAYKALTAAVQEGELKIAKVAAAYRRVLTLKRRLRG